MFTPPGSIAFLLLSLGMFHILQNVAIDACDEFYFLYKLRCIRFHISTIDYLNSQSLQEVIRS
jgi:hypothetical protein